MTAPALYILIGAIPLVILAAWMDYRRRASHRHMSTTEWRKCMAALEPGKPPVRTMDGDPQWRDPRKRRRKVKVVESKITPITKVGTRR